MMEKRKHLRIPMKNLWVDVGDGVEVFRGIVSDVSRSGIGIAGLPERLNVETKKMKIIISGKTGLISMNVGSKWCADGGAKKSVGVEIDYAPGRWTEFVMGFEGTSKTF
ncbi:MAG: PilZ domain-containing protein [Proteobacteria bacterium]|nr:PilZ domain-containing protein [Pseudomonadota bacterium]